MNKKTKNKQSTATRATTAPTAAQQQYTNDHIRSHIGSIFSTMASSSSFSSHAVERIRALSKSSHALSRAEDAELHRVSAIGEEGLRTAFREVIEEAAGGALLNLKSADGTPITSYVGTSVRLPNGRVQRRRGKRCEEFLVNNQFARRILPGGGVQTRVLLQEPVPLRSGKTALAIFQV